MLEDEKTYGKLNKDLTQRFKKKLVSILTRLKYEDKLSDQQYRHLYPTSEVVTRIYCTPKSTSWARLSGLLSISQDR